MPSTYENRARSARNVDPPADGDPADHLLTAEAERALTERIRGGDLAARDELVAANQGLVVTIALAFRGRGVDFDDLVQEGNLGLLRAIADFDPAVRQTRFSTYATHWIRSWMRRATLGGGSMIRLPDYLATLRRRFDRVRAEMIKERRSDSSAAWEGPSREEVARRMGVEPRKLRRLDESRVGCTSYSRSFTRSAYDYAGESDAHDLLIEDRAPEDPVLIVEQMEALHAALGRLPRFEAWLIRLRYRLDDRGDDDAPSPSKSKSPARSRPERGGELDGRRIERSRKRSRTPRPYRVASRECGLGVRQLKRIEREALEALRTLLGGGPSADRAPEAPAAAARPPRRRASA